MATQPVIFGTVPYADNARKLLAPATLLRGQENGLLPRALPALEIGDLELDLCELEQIDAAGLGFLAMLQGVAVRTGHKLSLLNPNPRVWRLLCLTGLAAVFTQGDAAFEMLP